MKFLFAVASKMYAIKSIESLNHGKHSHRIHFYWLWSVGHVIGQKLMSGGIYINRHVAWRKCLSRFFRPVICVLRWHIRTGITVTIDNLTQYGPFFILFDSFECEWKKKCRFQSIGKSKWKRRRREKSTAVRPFVTIFDLFFVRKCVWGHH